MKSAFTVFVDSNVFFGARLRSLLLYLAQSKLFRLRWSARIHKEWMRAAAEKRGIAVTRPARTRELMDLAVPDALVEGYEELEVGIELPDPDDRHVVAAAILAGADVILTFNGRDFPSETLRRFDLEIRHPDPFLQDLFDLSPTLFAEAVARDFSHYVAPELSFEVYVDALRHAGVPKAASLIERLQPER